MNVLLVTPDGKLQQVEIPGGRHEYVALKWPRAPVPLVGREPVHTSLEQVVYRDCLHFVYRNGRTPIWTVDGKPPNREVATGLELLRRTSEAAVSVHVALSDLAFTRKSTHQIIEAIVEEHFQWHFGTTMVRMTRYREDTVAPQREGFASFVAYGVGILPLMVTP